MSDYAEIAAHFARDFAEAKLTVQREDGLFRHIEFSAPKSMNRIILVTWPYNLLVAGSHGSYHFERFGPDTEDMFDWLRGIRVEPDRWASKLVNGADSVREYDRDRWKPRSTSGSRRRSRRLGARGLRAAVREQILDSHLLDSKDWAMQMVYDFEHGVTYRAECTCGAFKDHDSYDEAPPGSSTGTRPAGKKHKVKVRETGGFDFSDFTEWNVDKLNYHFVYQCHAASWAIAQYDAARKQVAA
jgi:hypothetical protein